MPKTVIEQLKDIQNQLSDLMKDRRLHEVSIGHLQATDPMHPGGHCGGLKVKIEPPQPGGHCGGLKVKIEPPQPGGHCGKFKVRKEPPQPSGHCGLDAIIKTNKDFVDALEKMHQWVGYMIEVSEK